MKYGKQVWKQVWKYEVWKTRKFDDFFNYTMLCMKKTQ